MEGARWDTATGGIVESRMMELFPMMPVIFVKAVTQDKQDTRNVYECPVYKIRSVVPVVNRLHDFSLVQDGSNSSLDHSMHVDSEILRLIFVLSMPTFTIVVGITK